MNSPSVSVIIPAHNPGVYLGQAIESVYKQTFQDWEILVVDDGSTEDIAAVCSAFPRVKLIRQVQLGASIARNVGILNSSGDFIAFLDHDDLWQSTKLEKQIAALNLDPAIGICHTDVAFIDAQDHPIYPKQQDANHDSDAIKEERITIHAITDRIDKSYSSSGILTSSSVVIRRSALAFGGLFDPDLNICGDTDLWLKICMHYQLAFVPSQETIYRVHQNNQSKNPTGRNEFEHLAARYESFGKHSGRWEPALFLRNLKLEAPKHLAAQKFDDCRQSLKSGHLFTALMQLISAVNLDLPFVAGSLILWLKMRFEK
ncbi:hypothetical protein BH10CYA1_BH10CYA1_54500 [soil metagenome]